MKTALVQYLYDYQYAQLLTADGHAFVADEPTDSGGDGLGPDPYELLLWSLGACTAMTLLMYARRHDYPLADIAVQVEHDRVYPDDSAATAEPGAERRKIEVLRRKITLRGDITDEQRERLLEIARRCPVHRTLAAAPEVVDTISVGE
ncbi:MAG TPA: OsmC family protein [Dehalococcoidia bacterium]|nr:OsmC family protein [Dehalococcoidia bacterium]